MQACPDKAPGTGKNRKPPPQDYIPPGSTRTCMLIAAHIFAGALLGLVFLHLVKDRRAVPFCMAGAILPDLMDKPLGLVFPFVLPGGRTLFHALIIAGIILVGTFLLVRSRSRWLGAGVACAVLVHQVMDEMWMLPANWFWPLLGPFQGHMIPDYIGTYFWVEMSDPSEWLFVIGSVMILAQAYSFLPVIFRVCRSDLVKTGAYALLAIIFLLAGVYLIIAGMSGVAPAFIAPHYSGLPTVMAGILSLGGTAGVGREVWGPFTRTAGSG